MARRRPAPSPAVAARQTRLAELLVAAPQLSHRALAARLGVSHATIQRDIAQLRAEWAARRLALVESRAAEDLVRSDHLLAALWPAATRGDPRAAATLLRALEYRARVLGLDQAAGATELGRALAELFARGRALGATAPPEAPHAAD